MGVGSWFMMQLLKLREAVLSRESASSTRFAVNLPLLKGSGTPKYILFIKDRTRFTSCHNAASEISVNGSVSKKSSLHAIINGSTMNVINILRKLFMSNKFKM